MAEPMTPEIEALIAEMRRTHEMCLVHCDGKMDADRARQWADRLAALQAQPDEVASALAHSDMVLSSVRAAIEGEPLNYFQFSIPLVRQVADLKAAPSVDMQLDPYSKVCDLARDAEQLAPFYKVVDDCPDALAGQHPIRRWEYAMALHAIQGWCDRTGQVYVEASGLKPAVGSIAPFQICDVGGAGSNFWQVLAGVTSEDIHVVDANAPDTPEIGQVQYWKCDVETAAAEHLHHNYYDILTSISVIEHVKDVRPFLHACHSLLKPGGLFFLTTDYWDAEGEDTAHFSWMRERIYNAESIRKFLKDLRELGFQSFGETDWKYGGHQVYNYSIASLAVVKK